jgi:hypothetical protein
LASRDASDLSSESVVPHLVVETVQINPMSAITADPGDHNHPPVTVDFARGKWNVGSVRGDPSMA